MGWGQPARLAAREQKRLRIVSPVYTRGKSTVLDTSNMVGSGSFMGPIYGPSTCIPTPIKSGPPEI